MGTINNNPLFKLNSDFFLEIKTNKQTDRETTLYNHQQ